MELKTDVSLRGAAWNAAIEAFGPVLRGTAGRTNYNIFMVALSIGILYDQRIDKLEVGENEDYKSVPRNVLQNNDNGKLDMIFQAAILSTTTQDFTEDERLELAFGEKTDFNKMAFLVEFANFGVTKLLEQKGDTELESMENIKNFVEASISGHNLDLEDLPDDILLEGEDSSIPYTTPSPKLHIAAEEPQLYSH